MAEWFFFVNRDTGTQHIRRLSSVEGVERTKTGIAIHWVKDINRPVDFFFSQVTHTDTYDLEGFANNVLDDIVTSYGDF